MEKKAIAANVARAEVEKWLEFKRVKDRHRESNSETIDHLVEAFEDGTLILDDDHNIIMHLTFGVGEGEKIQTLKFKPRLKVGEIHNSMKGIKSTDADARILAYIATLTEQPIGVIRQLDTEDYRISSSMVVFFF
jgi:F420-0:gamma-glutamyl ligase-like protein